jgi:hypothetical protein
MASVHRERGVSSRSSHCHYLRSSEPPCRPADGCILRSPQIVDVGGVKGRDAFRTRWTSWTLEAGFWCLFLHLLGNIWFVRDAGVRFPLTLTTAIFVEPRCVVDFCWKSAPTVKARYPSQLASVLNAGENNDPILTEWCVSYKVVSAVWLAIFVLQIYHLLRIRKRISPSAHVDTIETISHFANS